MLIESLKRIAIALSVAIAIVPSFVQADDGLPPVKQKSVVLFVEDATPDRSCAEFLPALSSKIQATLNQLGFKVIRPRDSASKRIPLDASSVLQIARDMGGDFYLLGTISEFSSNEIVKDVFDITMELDVNLNQSSRNEGVYGDKLSASVRKTSDEWPKNKTATVNGLINSCVSRAGTSIDRGLKSLRALPDDMLQIAFNVSLDKPSSIFYDVTGDGQPKLLNAMISIDGNVVGNSNEKIPVEKGLHEVGVEYPLCKPYVKQMKFTGNQEFDIFLELLDEGVERNKKASVFASADKYARKLLERKDRIEEAKANAELASIDIAGRLEQNAAKRKEQIEDAKASEQISQSKSGEALNRAKIEFLRKNSDAVFKLWLDNLRSEGLGSVNDKELAKIWVDTLENAIKNDARFKDLIVENGNCLFLSEDYWLDEIRKMTVGNVDSGNAASKRKD